MAKGSEYERQVCKQLSQWWTASAREDVFWRSSNSGGRATVRGRKGKGTFGSYGDIAAVDPIGQMLLEVVTIELKRGYSKCSVADLLDADRTSGHHQFGDFINQAMEAAERAGSFSWMLVQRRNKRKSLAFFPAELYRKLFPDESPHQWMKLRVLVKTRTKGYVFLNLAAVPLGILLLCTTPVQWQQIALEFKTPEDRLASKSKLIEREKRKRSIDKWRAKNPEKVEAHRLFRKAMKAGLLKKAPCEVCGDPKVHAHHADYSRPLDVQWLCVFHHRKIHRKHERNFRVSSA